MELPASVRDDLESYPNVIGTCLGNRRVNNQATDEESVIVLVSEKLSPEQLDPDDRIPDTVEIDGQDVRTDVQAIGEPRMQADVGVREPIVETEVDRTRRWRPAPAGVSIGHPEVTAGTLGTPVLFDSEDRTVVLTNAHIAAPIGSGSHGDPVYQPGPSDGGTDADEIGELREYSEIAREEPNTTDSALVAVDKESIAPEVLGIGPLAGIETSPDSDATYTKSGRTTGVTTGSQRGRDGRVKVGGYYDEPVVFEGVDVFDPMSAGGDSGSVIGVTRDGEFHATHLLFAGSDRVTLAIPMAAVQEEHGPISPAESEETGSFTDRVRRALTNGYGAAAVTEPESGPDFLVTTPFVSLVVVVAERNSELFDAAGRALSHTTDDTAVPAVACPESEAKEVGALGEHVRLITL